MVSAAAASAASAPASALALSLASAAPLSQTGLGGGLSDVSEVVRRRFGGLQATLQIMGGGESKEGGPPGGLSAAGETKGDSKPKSWQAAKEVDTGEHLLSSFKVYHSPERSQALRMCHWHDVFNPVLLTTPAPGGSAAAGSSSAVVRSQSGQVPAAHSSAATALLGLGGAGAPLPVPLNMLNVEQINLENTLRCVPLCL
jgi:hypothetical protein